MPPPSSESPPATYPPIPYPLVSPASVASSATYPPIPYPPSSIPRKSSSSSVSSNRTSTASTSSDKGYHTSVSNVPLSPISLASWKSAEDTTVLSDRGVSTPTVGVKSLPVGASVSRGEDDEGRVKNESGGLGTWVRARTDLYPIPVSVLASGADDSDSAEVSQRKDKKEESAVKLDLDAKGLAKQKQADDTLKSVTKEGPTAVKTKTSTNLKGLNSKKDDSGFSVLDGSGVKTDEKTEGAVGERHGSSSSQKKESLIEEGVPTASAVAAKGSEKPEETTLKAIEKFKPKEESTTPAKAIDKPEPKDSEGSPSKEEKGTVKENGPGGTPVKGVVKQGDDSKAVGKDGAQKDGSVKQESSRDGGMQKVKEGSTGDATAKIHGTQFKEANGGGADVKAAKDGVHGKQEDVLVKVDGPEGKQLAGHVTSSAAAVAPRGESGSSIGGEKVKEVKEKTIARKDRDSSLVVVNVDEGAAIKGAVEATTTTATATTTVKEDDSSKKTVAGGKKSKGKGGVDVTAVDKSEDVDYSNGATTATRAETAVKDNSLNLDMKDGRVTTTTSKSDLGALAPLTLTPPESVGVQSSLRDGAMKTMSALGGSSLGGGKEDVKSDEGVGKHTSEGVGEDSEVENKEKKEGRKSTLTIGSIPSSNSRPTSVLPSITTTTTSVSGGHVLSRHSHSQSFAYSQPHQQQQYTHSRHQSDSGSSSSFAVGYSQPTANHPPNPIRTSTSSLPSISTPEVSTISSHSHSHPHLHSNSNSNFNFSSYEGSNPNNTAKELTNDLLSTMKQTLSTMGATFDVLGEQTVKVAVLPAVLDVFEKISTIRRQLEEQHVNQETRMQEMKSVMLEEVRMKVYGRLREVVGEIVRGVVGREVERRVRRELYEQIPQRMRDEVEVYKRQIVEVRVSLHNSEARRHNALIRANSLDEPLIPLLRPPPQPLSLSIPSIGSTTTHSTSLNSNPNLNIANKALSAYTETEHHAPPPLPLTARVFSESQAHSHSYPRNLKNLGKLDTGVGRLRKEGMGGRGEVGTPSPFFPRDLMGLMKMGGEDAKMLLREYGLVRVRRRVVGHKEKEKEVGVDRDGERVGGEGGEGGEGEGERGEKEVEEVVEEEEEETREESINRFLAYIGVGFQVVPSPDAPTGVVNLTRVK